MIDIKGRAKSTKSIINTTISDDVLSDFKAYCKNIGLPMNLILEAFMVQFTNDEFTFKYAKNKRPSLELDLED